MYGDRRVRPTFARESSSVAVTLGRNGNLRIPSRLVPWRPGQRLFFRFNADSSITISLTPQGLYRGRYISSVLKRTVWWKSDGDFMRRATLAKARKSFKREALASWAAYKETGRHLTGQEVRTWLNAWGTP